MRKLLFALLLTFTFPFTANTSQAQGFTLMPYAGLNTEDGLGFLVGVGGEFVAPFELGDLELTIQPGVEYVSTDADGLSYFQVDGNVIARFGAEGASIAPFAGAGIGIGIISQDDIDTGFGTIEGDSSTEFGFNFLGGIAFPGVLEFGEPYAQARYSLIDPLEALSIMGGLRIQLGQ